MSDVFEVNLRTGEAVTRKANTNEQSEIDSRTANLVPDKKSELIDLARSEVRNRIRALFPRSDGSLRNDVELLFEQNNLQAEVQKLFNAEREVLNSGGVRPALSGEQNSRIETLKTLEFSVQSYRTKYRQLKSLINASSTIDELSVINVQDDIHWS